MLTRPGCLSHLAGLIRAAPAQTLAGVPEVFPIFPGDWEEADHAMRDYIRCTGRKLDDEKAISQAGVRSWVWLITMSYNYLYFGGRYTL